MAQKKKPTCLMPVENRQYYVQTMPLEKMHCGGKNAATVLLNNAVLYVNVLTNVALSILAAVSRF